MQNQELLAIGVIVKAFGIRGEVVAEPLTDQPARFRKLRAVRIGRDAAATREVRIAKATVEPRGVRILFAGVAERNGAEALVGEYLFVEPAQRIRLPKGRHFVHQVIGLSVVTEEGAAAGTVRDVLKLPAHDVYVVEHHGREYMIPGVREFILSIEPDRGTMRVRLIEGMKES
jgi:16S rRNA processing protein RimM